MLLSLQAYSAQVPQLQAHSVPLRDQSNPPLWQLQQSSELLDPLGLVRPQRLEQDAPANDESHLPWESQLLQAFYRQAWRDENRPRYYRQSKPVCCGRKSKTET